MTPDSPLTVVLDDDPTGTQSATDVTVLLRWDADAIAAVLADEGAVYLQTNSRAVPEPEAVELARRIRDELAEVEGRLGRAVLPVLRGDSTLRGHVFAVQDALFWVSFIVANTVAAALIPADGYAPVFVVFASALYLVGLVVHSVVGRRGQPVSVR